MSLTNMLTLAIYLDPTPGGVAPELHLKEGASSVQADLYILDASSFVDAKQKGDLLTGKTYSPDILSGKRLKNDGQSPQYYIEEHHDPIVSPALFDRVQRIIKKYRRIGT